MQKSLYSGLTRGLCSVLGQAAPRSSHSGLGLASLITLDLSSVPELQENGRRLHKVFVSSKKTCNQNTDWHFVNVGFSVLNVETEIQVVCKGHLSMFDNRTEIWLHTEEDK